MNEDEQRAAPIYEALERFRRQRVVPFDVPGHKRGRGNPELVTLLGERCVGLDVNSMKPLDNLGHPVSVIRDAERLTADAFSAKHAFLMVNGTTSAVQAMILSVIKEGRRSSCRGTCIRASSMPWCSAAVYPSMRMSRWTAASALP